MPGPARTEGQPAVNREAAGASVLPQLSTPAADTNGGSSDLRYSTREKIRARQRALRNRSTPAAQEPTGDHTEARQIEAVERVLPDGRIEIALATPEGGRILVTREQNVLRPTFHERDRDGEKVIVITSEEPLAEIMQEGENAKVEAITPHVDAVFVTGGGDFVTESVEVIQLDGTAVISRSLGRGTAMGPNVEITVGTLEENLRVIGPQHGEAGEPAVIIINTLPETASLVVTGQTVVNIIREAAGGIKALEQTVLNGEVRNAGVYHVEPHDHETESGVILAEDKAETLRQAADAEISAQAPDDGENVAGDGIQAGTAAQFEPFGTAQVPSDAKVHAVGSAPEEVVEVIENRDGADFLEARRMANEAGNASSLESVTVEGTREVRGTIGNAQVRGVFNEKGEKGADGVLITIRAEEVDMIDGGRLLADSVGRVIAWGPGSSLQVGAADIAVLAGMANDRTMAHIDRVNGFLRLLGGVAFTGDLADGAAILARGENTYNDEPLAKGIYVMRGGVLVAVTGREAGEIQQRFEAASDAANRAAEFRPQEGRIVAWEVGDDLLADLDGLPEAEFFRIANIRGALRAEAVNAEIAAFMHPDLVAARALERHQAAVLEQMRYQALLAAPNRREPSVIHRSLGQKITAGAAAGLSFLGINGFGDQNADVKHVGTHVSHKQDMPEVPQQQKESQQLSQQLAASTVNLGQTFVWTANEERFQSVKDSRAIDVALGSILSLADSVRTPGLHEGEQRLISADAANLLVQIRLNPKLYPELWKKINLLQQTPGMTVEEVAANNPALAQEIVDELNGILNDNVQRADAVTLTRRVVAPYTAVYEGGNLVGVFSNPTTQSKAGLSA